MSARRRPAESQCRLFACVAGLLDLAIASRGIFLRFGQRRSPFCRRGPKCGGQDAARARLRRAGVFSASESTWKLSNKSTSAVDDNYLPKYRSEPGAIRVN